MRTLSPLFALVVVAALAVPAAAQTAPADPAPYIDLQCKDLGDDPPKFNSRAACRELVNSKDNKVLLARLKNVMRPAIHDEDGRLMARNYRHVIIAYASMWILAVVFLALLFLRQRNLTAEIARLSAELARAVREEEE